MKHPPGKPMTLGNMRHLGVHHLIATCLSDACRHQGLIDVSSYPADTEVPSFASSGRHRNIGAGSVRPSHRQVSKERPPALRLLASTIYRRQSQKFLGIIRVVAG